MFYTNSLIRLNGSENSEWIQNLNAHESQRLVVFDMYHSKIKAKDFTEIISTEFFWLQNLRSGATDIKVISNEEKTELETCKAAEEYCDQQTMALISEIAVKATTITNLEATLIGKDGVIKNLEEKVKLMTDSKQND